VTGEPSKFICRGQVIPDSDHEVSYEIFVDEIIMSPQPTLFATLLASSDGKKVFYCPRFGLKLVPRWPKLAGPMRPARQVGTAGDVRGDETALAEMASGAPSRALGSLYAHFDNGGRLPRLPSPPFHFVTRVVSVDGAPGQKEAGPTAAAEYDVPPEAWYFRDSGSGKMPLAVLTEIALQPCGWLAGFCGLALSGDSYFRNLDGKATVHVEIGPDSGTLGISTKLTRISRAGPLTIVFYDVDVTDSEGRAVMSMETSFGFFTAEALAAQAGLKRNEDALAALALPAMEVDGNAGAPEGPTGRMAMLDRVDYWNAAGGEAGQGRIRGRQGVDPRAWYFRAHFFSDPVQPGSLGLDALAQLAARAAALKGLGERFAHPRFELLAAGEDLSWTYRGQVTPETGEVTTLVDILEIDAQPERTLVTARGHLFIDGMRIYEMPRFTLAVRETEPAPGRRRNFIAADTPWVSDHRPTRTVPALPLMAMAGMALETAVARAGGPVRLENFAPEAWATVPKTGLWLEATSGEDGALRLTGDEGLASSDRRRHLAKGQWRPAPANAPEDFTLPAPGDNARDISDLYTSCDLFHGPAMQTVTGGRRDASGFEITLDLSRAARPGDAFDPVILDGLVHGVPHQSAEDWFALEGDWIIYPRLIRSLTVFGSLPETGTLTVRGAPLGDADPPDILPLRIEAFSEAGCFAVMELVEKAFPKGRFARLDPQARFAFIAGERVSNMTPLTDHDDGTTRLRPADLMACDWLPGSVATAYGAKSLSGTALVKSVLIREHFARAWDVHPARIDHDGVWAWTDSRPRTRYTLRFDRAAKAWSVQNG
jgi:3-hydroxymyristoyl/3-hydroxydecanoyl-(acyl carrier protein) dehydratase